MVSTAPQNTRYIDNSEAARFLMHDTQALSFQDQIFEALSDEADELPEVFTYFWQEWYQISQENCHEFYQLLGLLEELLFQSSDELLTHPLSSPLCRALRFWQLQIQRYSAEKEANQKKAKPLVKVNLRNLMDTWELFQSSFIPRMEEYKTILIKSIAVPFSFCGLAIIKTIDKEALQRQSSISLYSSISTQIHNKIGSQESAIEHSWAIDLITAKFQKTVGYLAQAEKLLQNLCKNLQQGQHRAIYSSALFELCDIYCQMEQDQLLHSTIRKLLLHNPATWDFALVGSLFCSQLLHKLPFHIRSQFASDNPVALNWAGLYVLADGDYGEGSSLSRQQQKTFWAQILQLKKAISDQKINARQAEHNSSPQNDLSDSTGSTIKRSQHVSGEFYNLQRAQLLIYYILILEHLNQVRKAEISEQVLEENSALWQNVMIEIYSLSEDISQRCKNRFSHNH